MKKSASTSKIVMTTLCLNVEMESVSLTNIIVINMIIVVMGLMKLDAVAMKPISLQISAKFNYFRPIV